MKRLSSGVITRIQKMKAEGASLSKIAKDLGVAKSTVSKWTRGLPRAKSSPPRGREKVRPDISLASVFTNKKVVWTDFKDVDFWRLQAASLYWCEGEKGTMSSGVRFMNADPELMSFFLYALRKGFQLDERKFRALLHLHEGQNEEWSREYWSKVTGIPTSQFHRSYIKKSGLLKKEGYMGCCSLRYQDAGVARTLEFIYKSMAKMIGV